MAGKLLSAPLECSVPTEVKFTRTASEDPSNQDFQGLIVPPEQLVIQGARNYQRQYWHIYSARLTSLRPRVIEAVKEHFGTGKHAPTVVSLCDLDAWRKHDKDVVVVGTMFKHQELKPNILKDLSEDHNLVSQPSMGKTKFISDEDELILEDEDQRIKVLGEVNKAEWPTGIVCGLYGREGESGKFMVKKIIYPKVVAPFQKPKLEQDSCLALLSGLELSDDSCAHLLPLQLCIDWLIGEAGEMDDQKLVAKIERVIIAGNALSESTRNKDEMSKAKYLTKDSAAGSIQAVQMLDDFLVQIAGSMDVSLMPGEYDPANQIMPQQPLHPCLFPLASSYSTLKTVTNPCSIESQGLRILGFSGQNVDDILRNTSLEDPLDALEIIIRASHMAPTCPDTLGCFPFREKDPFIMEQLPHVIFAGNQEKFDQRSFEIEDAKILLLSVPKFSITQSLILLNMNTLEAEEIVFSATSLTA